jgi:hypothetical protein
MRTAIDLYKRVTANVADSRGMSASRPESGQVGIAKST